MCLCCSVTQMHACSLQNACACASAHQTVRTAKTCTACPLQVATPVMQSALTHMCCFPCACALCKLIVSVLQCASCGARRAREPHRRGWLPQRQQLQHAPRNTGCVPLRISTPGPCMHVGLLSRVCSYQRLELRLYAVWQPEHEYCFLFSFQLAQCNLSKELSATYILLRTIIVPLKKCTSVSST